MRGIAEGHRTAANQVLQFIVSRGKEEGNFKGKGESKYKGWYYRKLILSGMQSWIEAEEQ